MSRERVAPMTAVNDTAIVKGDGLNYPIIGEFFTEFFVMECWGLFRKNNLKRHWNCLEKAQLTAGSLVAGNFCKAAVVVVGELDVFGISGETSYGFDYKPPAEFHAWVEGMPDGWLEIKEEQKSEAIKDLFMSDGSSDNWVIDLALPGVIEAGLILKDDKTTLAFTNGREPCILASKKSSIPGWIKYNAVMSLYLFTNFGGKVVGIKVA